MASTKTMDRNCKQIVFGLNIVADEYVPVSFQLFDGNRTDDTTHRVNWDDLRSLLEKEDFIYVADCKLCSAENLAHTAGNGGKLITIVPKNRVDVKKFHDHIRAHGVKWVDAYKFRTLDLGQAIWGMSHVLFL